MSALSNAYENSVLDHILGTASLTSPAAVYVGLFKSTVDEATTTANLEAGTLTDEISGGSYARVAATFDSAASGSTSNDGNITFTTAAANWGMITHIAVLDASTSGNVIVHGVLDVEKQIDTGDTFQITTGNLTITLA
jgi:hypothetical protein